MSRLAEDIDILQRAADAAGLIIYAGGGNRSYPERDTIVRPDTLAALASELEARSQQPRDYRLIDYEAVWLLRAAQQICLHQADGNGAKAERFRKLGEYMRAAVETDLVNARKSLGVM